MKFRWFVILLAAAFTALTAAAVENKGAEEISIDGGSRGNVPFPHRAHQTRINDCNICHEAFPQEPGALANQKAGGKLQPKEVMNKQCVKCHKAESQAGNKSGPTTCSKCHLK